MLWIWAVSVTLALLFLLILIVTAVALGNVSGQYGAFFAQAGCPSYWDFVLAAGERGLGAAEIERLFADHGGLGQHSIAETCGAVADVLENLL